MSCICIGLCNGYLKYCNGFLLFFFLLFPISNCIVSNISQELFYISTHDSLLDHYFQVEILWSLAEARNRQLYLSRQILSAPGYDDSKVDQPQDQHINICDIFFFPSNIVCTNLTIQEVVNSHSCILTGKRQDWYVYIFMYIWKWMNVCMYTYRSEKSLRRYGFTPSNTTFSSSINFMTEGTIQIHIQ